jgi:hexokinase
MSKFNPSELAEFARSYGFHYDICDPATLVRDFRTDMERGLRGQSSAQPMIPAYITPVTKVPEGKTVVALDAGGTNLRAAKVTFGPGGRPVTEGLVKGPMPGTKGKVSAEEFFDEMALLAAPLFDGMPVTDVGFCFSYAMEIQKNGDGILIAFSKEVDAPEVIGKAVGQGLREALERRGVKNAGSFILLNDTVATLLSGLAELPPDCGFLEGKDNFGAEAGHVIGMILGTGFNTAYPEKEIPKIGFSGDSPQIVVCESGNAVPRFTGVLDREFDAGTKKPGAYLLEKAVSGEYLGPLSFHILKQAVADGVLSFKRAKEFAARPNLITRELNEFLHAPLTGEGPVGSFFAKDELDAIRSFVYLCSVITRRGALFAASILGACVERMDSGYDPFAPVRIAVEGTTFVRYMGMREHLEAYLRVILNREKPRTYAVTTVEQASLFGAAVAALSR